MMDPPGHPRFDHESKDGKDNTKVDRVDADGTDLIHLHPHDIRVIGRKGIHADAIRRIVHAAGGKRKMRYVLEIIEDR